MRQKNVVYKVIWLSSRGGLGVERRSDNRLYSAPVDKIQLEEIIPAIDMFYIYMVPTPTDVC